MKALLYNDLNAGKLSGKVSKVIQFLEQGDFRSADVKKMPDTGYYRARLDDTNRLLFRIGAFEGTKFLFILEIIHNHAYEKSRFLNGAALDEARLAPVADEQGVPESELLPVGYIHPQRRHFHLLDKILSFDDIQEDVLQLPVPSIVIGSAGSGKTAITLEKVKQLPGRVLYTTLSPYLAENASALYSSFGYENDRQEVEFLSFSEYMSTIDVPKGKEVDFRSFEAWISRYRQSYKIKDAYQIFEEFKGVLTGSVVDKPYLGLDDYLSLGVRQSIVPAGERESIYGLFTKYLEWLKEGGYYDSNLVAHGLLSIVIPAYDYVVVDEVQDFTNVQLMLILKSLHHPANFILCGDANQIVHPNFFSWSQVKSLYYKQDLKGDIIRILAANYRNTPEVTRIANQLLLIKNARFGSIDKESTYLVQSSSKHAGQVEFLENTARNTTELNRKTSRSARFAVLVLRHEDKAAARAVFKTPLLFSIQEAKGLEYENIILYNAISGYDREFRELTAGVTREELTEDALKYARAKDKTDKSLDVYKFYVNSLYVGITRAIRNLYIIETNKKHDLLALLDLTDFKQQSSVKDQSSSQEDWQREARRLELQGKQEQADDIRRQILQVQSVPWEVITRPGLKELERQALNPELFNKKAKDRLYEYALFYGEQGFFRELSLLKYRPADKWETDGKTLLKRLLAPYYQDQVKDLLPEIRKYGVDYRNAMNLTPFMLAITFGAEKVAAYLIENGARIDPTDNYGRNPLQLAILQTYLHPGTRQQVLNRFYPALRNESLKVKIRNRLIKIDSHQAEYLMLHFMISVLRPQLVRGTTIFNFWKDRTMPAFQTIDFVNFFSGLSLQVVPEYRRNRSYISSILSKNEISREDKYNKQLFVRLRLGMYVPNPAMEVLIESEWVNLYDLIDIDDIERHAISGRYFIDGIKKIRADLQQGKLPEEPAA